MTRYALHPLAVVLAALALVCTGCASTESSPTRGYRVYLSLEDPTRNAYTAFDLREDGRFHYFAGAPDKPVWQTRLSADDARPIADFLDATPEPGRSPPPRGFDRGPTYTVLIRAPGSLSSTSFDSAPTDDLDRLNELLQKTQRRLRAQSPAAAQSPGP